MKRKNVFVFIAFLLFFTSACKEDVSRYPSVEIPAYGPEDYYSLLSDRNPEIVYNAVCNLMGDASEMAKVLSDNGADKNSPKYQLAQKTFDKILKLLSARDERVVAGALRFLQLFAADYARSEDLIAPVLRIRSNRINVQYEQVTVLIEIASDKSALKAADIRRFVNNRSWLVSRQAYSLVSKSENKQLRRELIAKYRSMKSEMEKILILKAFSNNFSADDFKFLSREFLSSQSRKIKDSILALLDQARDQSAVIKWIEANYPRFSRDDLNKLDQICSSNVLDEFSADVYEVLLRHGFVPGESFFAQVARITTAKEEELKEFVAKEKAKYDDFLKLKKIIMENEIFKKLLLESQEKVEQEPVSGGAPEKTVAP